MTDEQIYAGLATVFEDVFDNEEPLGPATVAADIPGWDSIGHIRLMLAVEDEFGIKFKSAEVGALKDVGALVALIRGKLAG